MQVHLKGFTNNNSDAIVVIECECGNRWMLDEAGEFQSEEIFVYRHGVPVKNLRCSPPESETLSKIANEAPWCRERYRIALHDDESSPSLEVAHVTPRPCEKILESNTIKFPPKQVGTDAPINPPPATEYVTNPYL